MKVLIVDDNDQNLYMLEALLRGNGHHVVSAHDGDEALAGLKAEGADVIISDILMPVMDGFQLCRAVRSDDALKDIPFVFYTATYTEAKDVKFGLSLGADRYLIKPQPDALLQAVTDLIAERTAGAAVRQPLGKEMEFFRQHNEALFRKLEKKISDLELANRTLRESEEKYRSLFEESKDVVFISTPEGRFIDINQAGVELFGYSSKEELLEVDIERDLYVHLDYRKELLKMLDDQGYVKDYELLMKNKNGDILIVLETATAFRDKMGFVASYRGMLRDITHQRKLEQQLMQAQKMEAVGQLAGGIAHDFNNFLTAIMGYGSILQMGMEEDNALRTHVRQILSSAERAANLTKQLLIFSRKQVMDPRPVKINQIIFAIEKLISRLIGEDIDMKLTLSPEDLTIRADICQIEQVLMNLATNARDAMPNGGMLTIKTESVVMDDEFMRTHGYDKEGTYVVLTVSDTGEGMDEKTREKIFEPFFTTKEAGKGTGLGLAMVYGIVKQHNGYINVYSEHGEGTSFRIYLPSIEDTVEEKMTPGQPDAIGGNETVLLTEDDSEVRKMVSGLLTDFGYTVIEAKDGEDAVERFREHRDDIQLVILDVIMPKKNGKEVYSEVVQMKPEIKVIFASGYPVDVIRRKGIIEEGMEFISKPFAPSEFLKTIRKVLQQKAAN